MIFSYLLNMQSHPSGCGLAINKGKKFSIQKSPFIRCIRFETKGIGRALLTPTKVTPS